MQASISVVLGQNVALPARAHLRHGFLQAARCLAVVVALVGSSGAQTPQTAGLVQLTQQTRIWVAANNRSSKKALPVHEEPSEIEKRLETEILELHQFFEGWFTGRLANTDENYSRLSDVLAEGFEMISPQGSRTARADVVAGLRPAHGSWSENEKPGRIWIRDIRSRAVGESHYLATYEEWQQTDGAPRGRLSTVLFREKDDAPNGVEWIHLHETWLPEKK